VGGRRREGERERERKKKTRTKKGGWEERERWNGRNGLAL
jgi:hypothetical protein